MYDSVDVPVVNFPVSNLKNISQDPQKLEPRVGDTSTRILSGLNQNIPPFQGGRVL